MAQRRDSRFDFRGGANLAFTDDAVDSTEVRKAKNARAGGYAGLQTRSGTQRIHQVAMGGGAPVLGLHQWFPPGGRRLVAVSGGNLYEKPEGTEEFTEVGTGLSETARPSFQAHIEGGNINLFIADGGMHQWDGTDLTAVTGAPDAVQLAIYKTRMFALDGSKTVYWSRISDPTTWSSPDGGQGNVETYDADPIVGLGVTGASLLLFKENSIARFTGVSAANIRIDQETEGISPDIGCIAPGTICRVEQALFFLTDRGPYIASEAGVQAIGQKVEPAFDEAEMDHMKHAVAVHNPKRREVWVFFPENTKTTNTVGWCFNTRMQNWYGPWDMGEAFDVASAANFELPSNKENVVLGGYDGVVRLGDVKGAAKDDIGFDGTGGRVIEFEIEFPDLLFGDPTLIKRLNRAQHISADLGVKGVFHMELTSDLGGSNRLRIFTRGSGTHQYLFRPGTYGRRIGLRVKDESGEVVRINGLSLQAQVSDRQV